MSFIDLFGRRRPRQRFSLITDYVDLQLLPHAPKGWDSSLINYSRSETYYGMVRNFTIPIEYVKDGAWLLRKAFYGVTGKPGHGIEANVQLLIERENSTTWAWETVYQGDNDFSQFKDNDISEGDTVTISVMEGGITKFVKAYEDVAYTIPIPLTGADARLITMTPIKLKETAQFISQGIHPDANNGEFPALTLVTNEQKAINPSVFAQPQIVYDGSPNFATAGCFFYQATIDGKVRFTNVDIEGTVISLGGTTDCEVSIWSSIHGEIKQFYQKINPPNFDPITYTGDFSLGVVSGERLFFYTRSNTASTYAFITSAQWSMAYDTISADTNVPACTGQYLHQQLMNKMNGATVPVQSYLLSTTWDNLLFTSGNAIKPFVPTPIYSTDSVVTGVVYTVFIAPIVYNGHTYTVAQTFTAGATPNFTSEDDNAYVEQVNVQPSIIISWKDFFTSINGMLGAGWGVQGNVSVLEAKSYWYQPSLVAASVGTVKKGSNMPYLTYMYSSIKTGYADQTYDQINGVTEFNSTVQFQSQVTRVKKEYDITSKIRADSTGAELLRVGLNQQAQGSSSTAGNNDTWAIYCLPDGMGGWYPEPASAFGTVSGLDTNLYNLRISPGENLRRHSDFLAGVFAMIPGSSLFFASGLKNVNLSRIGSQGQRIQENANITVSSLGAPLFLPIECDITIKEPTNMVTIMNTRNTGVIRATSDGVNFEGFILDCSTDITYNKEQPVKLLFSPNNNLIDWVR